MAEWSLNDKVIFVTGGARGIGAATARELARRGARLALADLDAEALAQTAAQIRPTPLTIELDVTDAAGCDVAIAQTIEHFGRIDVVWANAGIGTLGPVALTDPDMWRRTVDVNLVGAYNTVRAGLDAVIAQQGLVVITASAASFGHSPLMSAYSATKAGVEAMGDSLRIEVAHHGVDVSVIHPIWIDTDMVREGEASQRAFAVLRASLRPPFKKTQPLERAVKDIVAGIAARKRRIFSPPFVAIGFWLRSLVATPLFERDQLAAAPEMERVFREEVSERGVAGASTSERVAGQMRRS